MYNTYCILYSELTVQYLYSMYSIRTYSIIIVHSVQYEFPDCVMYYIMQSHQNMIDPFLRYWWVVPTVCVGSLHIDTVVLHTVVYMYIEITHLVVRVNAILNYKKNVECKTKYTLLTWLKTCTFECELYKVWVYKNRSLNDIWSMLLFLKSLKPISTIPSKRQRNFVDHLE